MRLLPILMLSPTLVLTGVAKLHPAVFHCLRRDPVALQRGELWRLISPLLIQADFLRGDGEWVTLAVFVLAAAILAVAERAFGVRRTLLLYGVGALVGHTVGELWQPYSSGCSVAACGVLGALVAWLSRGKPVQARIGAGLVLALALLATIFRDIHGPALLAGALLGAWVTRSVPLPGKLA